MQEPDKSRWLPGARLNIAHCALASPLAPPDAPAIVWAQDGSPQQLNRLSWLELRRRAGHVAECARQLFAPGGPPSLRPLCRAAPALGYLAGRPARPPARPASLLAPPSSCAGWPGARPCGAPVPRPPAGDAVAINMPMTAEAVVIYLGLGLAGCAVVSIADSFAADEVRGRGAASRPACLCSQPQRAAFCRQGRRVHELAAGCS